MSFTTKLILWPLIIVTVVAIGLWISGGKQQEYSASIQIDASPQLVFEYLTEAEKHKTWLTGLVHVEDLESNVDEDGHFKRNSTARVIAVDGKETRFEDEVIRFGPNETVSVRSSNRSQVITSIYRLEPKGGQTLFTYRVIKNHRGIQRCLAPLRNDKTQDQVDSDIRKLKQLVESRS